MKHSKKLLCLALVALLVIGTAVSVQAKSYSVEGGTISVVADKDGQTVTTIVSGTPSAPEKDASPVINGTTDKYSIVVDADDGATAELTLNGVTVTSSNVSTLDLYPTDGKINLILQGDNKLIGKQGVGFDGLYILGSGADTSCVSIQGEGSLTATAGTGATLTPVYVDGAALSMNGGSVTAVSPDYYAVGLYNNSTLTVSGDYLHPASIIADSGKGGFDIDSTSQVIIGENNFVLDENGRDITAEVLANPDLLKTLKYVIISTKDIAVFPNDDLSSNVHIMTAYKNTRFEKTGEPGADAMKTLSEGMKGEALYAGSFAFTDDFANHGKFQVNIMLPEYAGQHVKLVTLENGSPVVYDRWVSNNGMVWCHVDHLGDFAVFAA